MKDRDERSWVLLPADAFRDKFLDIDSFFSRIKKGEDQAKEKCHVKSVISNGANERIKICTQRGSGMEDREERVLKSA